CCSKRTRSGWSAATTTSARSISPTPSRHWWSGLDRRYPKTAPPSTPTTRSPMPEHTLSILKPSVNNLTARIFVRAANLDFEELDVWGKTMTPEFLTKDPAHLTPMLEEEGLPEGSLWESCAIMQYLCNKHELAHLYPTD